MIAYIKVDLKYIVKFQKISEMSKGLENNMSRAVQSAFEINIVQFSMKVVAVTC